MARKRELTWFKARSKWKRVYQGKHHYLKSPARNKSDDEGYQAALAEWQAVKAWIDGEGPEPYAGGEWNPDDYQRRLARWIIVRQAEKAESQPASNGHADHVQSMATDYTKHAFTPGLVARVRTGDVALSDLCDEYLRQRRVKAGAGKLSIKQYAQDKAKLNDFLGFAKHHGKAMLSEIDGPFLGFYRECEEALTGHKVASERISGETARKRLQTVLKLWRWAYQQEYLDRLPRVLDTNFAQITIKRPKPKFWEVDEIRTLFNKASNRTKLYIALGCNCGYTQAEISTLDWSMIDKTTREIRRDRPKSGQPQVHVLWPITYELLCAESPDQTGLCLMGQKGNELLTQRIKADGNITHVDSVRLAFNRTLKKTKLSSTGRTFKHLRKTSAQAIMQKYEDVRLVDMFLAHSTRGAMREHYTEPVYASYFQALEWLQGFYDFQLQTAGV